MTIFIGGDQVLVGQERVRLDAESYRGDTNLAIVFDNVDLGEVLNPIVDVAIALTRDGIERARLDVAGGDITIDTFNSFTINEHTFDIPEYLYKYDIQITLESGFVQSPIYGFWKIKEDQTKP